VIARAFLSRGMKTRITKLDCAGKSLEKLLGIQKVVRIAGLRFPQLSRARFQVRIQAGKADFAHMVQGSLLHAELEVQHVGRIVVRTNGG